MKLRHYLAALGILVLAPQAVNAEPVKAKQPNIILFFTDDAGYADFGFHGSKEIMTPRLDELAHNGTLFTQAYVSDATCGPSRAGLLTGRYQQRFGFEENNVPTFMSEASGADGDDMGVPLSEVTIGDYMKQLNYATAYYGKWHLGGADRFHPTKRGFDEFYGFRGGARSYFAYDNHPPSHLDWLERGFGNFKEHDGYLTDKLAEEAIDFIGRNKEKPFFIWLAYNAVHTPMQATAADKALYPNLKGKRQTVAAMTTSMDRATGKVLDKLKELGLDENTLIVFTNDNGGPSDKNASVNLPLSGSKSNFLEGGIRVPFIMKWPGQVKENSKYTFPISTLDLLPTFYAAGGGDVSKLKNLDGVNLLPYIQGKKAERPHDMLFWKLGTRAVVRQGDWKLLRFPDRPAELYYVTDDIKEHNNLASQQPERLKQMYKALWEWELTLERPRWLLQKKFEKYDVERMDQYR